MLMGQCEIVEPDLAHELEVARQRIIEVRVVGNQIAVADVQRWPQHADVIEQLDRRAHVLLHDLVELDDAVGGVGRHRQLALVGGLHCALQ